MEDFWAFVNRKEVRIALALFCLVLFVHGIYRTQSAQTTGELFRGGGQMLLWCSWALVNILHVYEKVAPRLSITVNTGIAMIIVSFFVT